MAAWQSIRKRSCRRRRPVLADVSTRWSWTSVGGQRRRRPVSDTAAPRARRVSGRRRGSRENGEKRATGGGAGLQARAVASARVVQEWGRDRRAVDTWWRQPSKKQITESRSKRDITSKIRHGEHTGRTGGKKRRDKTTGAERIDGQGGMRRNNGRGKRETGEAGTLASAAISHVVASGTSLRPSRGKICLAFYLASEFMYCS